MNVINAWLNANILHIVAIAAGLAIRWGAMQFLATATKSTAGGKSSGGPHGGTLGGGGGGGGRGKKWNKTRVIKFMTLLFVFVAGLMLAYGTYPLAAWVLGWGGTFGGIVATITGVLTIAAGWHALHGGAGLVHDMTDGTPDDEAFNSAFWVPTLIPLGWAALVGLFTEQRGMSNFLAAVAISIVTAIYAHKIMRRAYDAQGHHGLWMYFAFMVSGFVGVIHVVALAYINQAIGEYLPPWAAILARSAFAITAVVLLIAGLGDWIRDRIPEKWSQLAAAYSVPVIAVGGAWVFGLGDTANDSLNIVFGSLR